MERVRRIELRLPDRRSGAQPMGHTRKNFGADGDNRNLFSGLEAQGTPYIPRPHHAIFNCQRTIWAVHTHFDPLASNGKQVRHSLNAVNKNKKGSQLRWLPFLKIGMLFQDGQVIARASVMTHDSQPAASLLNWNKCFTQFNPKLTLRRIQAFSWGFCYFTVSTPGRCTS